jgi:hypothetical protein
MTWRSTHHAAACASRALQQQNSMLLLERHKHGSGAKPCRKSLFAVAEQL